MTRSEAITALYALFNAPHNADINLVGLNVLLDELYLSPQPEQEPVKDWIASHNDICALLRQAHDALALTSYPPQRTWIGLTDEEIKAFDTWHDNREEEVGWCNPSEIVAYIEAKLKQKNGYAEEKNT